MLESNVLYINKRVQLYPLRQKNRKVPLTVIGNVKMVGEPAITIGVIAHYRFLWAVTQSSWFHYIRKDSIPANLLTRMESFD